eukprot:Amastigsp_a518016_18.p3 type:complete len:184 gc:universal Amastigsp_a518016_18:684-133(-)
MPCLLVLEMVFLKQFRRGSIDSCTRSMSKPNVVVGTLQAEENRCSSDWNSSRLDLDEYVAHIGILVLRNWSQNERPSLVQCAPRHNLYISTPVARYPVGHARIAHVLDVVLPFPIANPIRFKYSHLLLGLRENFRQTITDILPEHLMGPAPVFSETQRNKQTVSVSENIHINVKAPLLGSRLK